MIKPFIYNTTIVMYCQVWDLRMGFTGYTINYIYIYITIYPIIPLEDAHTFDHIYIYIHMSLILTFLSGVHPKQLRIGAAADSGASSPGRASSTHYSGIVSDIPSGKIYSGEQ
jgi:hypothetical protein